MIRYIFFLIPLALIPAAYAEPVLYQNYEEELIATHPDGSKTFKWTSTAGTNRILDGTEWKDFIFTDNINHLRVETSAASVLLDKNTCEFSYYSGGVIGGKTPILTDDIIPYNSVTGSGVWSLINSVNDAACVASWDGSELKATKSAGPGFIEYAYILDGSRWKTELRATNESGLNNREFGFIQVVNLNRDMINYGGSLRNLDNFDGSVFDRTWLETNEGKVIDLLNGNKFDFDLGFEKLNRVWINDTGANSSLLSFEYFFNQTVIPDGQTLVIDPTFSSNNPTEDGTVTDTDNNNVCDDIGATYTQDTTSTILLIGPRDQAGATDCMRAYFEYDISSVGGVIDDVVFEWDTQSIKTTGIDACDFYGMATQPTTRTAAQIFDEIDDGSLLVDDELTCKTIGNNKSVDLGAAGDTYIDGQLGAGWAAIGVRANDETVPLGKTFIEFGSEEDAGAVPKPTLTIEYTIGAVNSPGPPINPTATQNRHHLINFTWTPNNATGVTGYAIFNATTNSTNPSDWVNIANTGNTSFYTITGLPYDSKMWLKTSAFSLNNGTNSTTAYGLTLLGPPNAVETLTTTDIDFTTVDLSWVQPNFNGGILSGYQINRSSPWTETPNIVLINDTQSVVTTYQDTGLSINTNYTYRVSAYTTGGTNTTFGQILNITTLNFIPANFTIGSINLNLTNTEINDMFFERIDINETALFLNVTYPNTWDLVCNFDYKFAQVSKNYTNLPNSTAGAGQVESSFLFKNVDNEIIDVYCWDQITPTNDGDYLITQTAFPLLDQIADFRAGEFGTAGDFGAIDFITLLVVIMSMIGFNRVNETAGAVFNIALIGGLGYFGIIEVPTVILSSIALVIMLVIGSTKKN